MSFGEPREKLEGCGTLPLWLIILGIIVAIGRC